MSRTNVAVVIVSWESAGYLSDAVTSAQACLLAGDQVIIWDNASSATTQTELDAIAERWPALIIERCNENLGFAVGNNRAIALAGPDHDILCLNPDAQLKPGALTVMREVLSTDQKIGAVGAIQLTPDESTIDGLGDRLTLSGRPQRIAIGEPAANVSRYISAEPYDAIFSPCAAVALYRRKAFDETGGFDADYFCYCEDVDLGFRMRLAGYTCVRANQAIALHAGSASAGRHSDFTSFHGHRNLVWNFVKNMPAPLLIGLAISHLALNAASCLYFVAKGRPAVLLRAKRAALRGLPKMWRKRRLIQQRRRASVSEIFNSLG